MAYTPSSRSKGRTEKWRGPLKGASKDDEGSLDPGPGEVFEHTLKPYLNSRRVPI
jgi:hypothetical protein